MTDIRQTARYAEYLKLLGWETTTIKNCQIFTKKFPLIGSIIKVQRVKPPLPFGEIAKIARKEHAFQILIDQEPERTETTKFLKNENQEIWKNFGYRINGKPYFPTKTIWIDLTKNENEIFDSFSEAKRRAVRKAQKNGVVVRQVKTAREFLWLKKKSLVEKFVLPWWTTKEIDFLYQAFFPKNARILIAYQQNQPVAGIFLLHADQIAYYWLAASTNQGKKLFAPTFLAWEAFKSAKKLGCRCFDFEGIYDERYPVKSWLGFTKFKQGFGGKEIYYPPSLIKRNLFLR